MVEALKANVNKLQLEEKHAMNHFSVSSEKCTAY